MSFQPSTSDPPDAIDLELLRIGGLDPTRAAQVSEASRSHLADEEASLLRAEELFAAKARPLRPAVSVGHWAAGGLIAAAAAALFVLAMPTDDGVRSMGGTADELAVTIREGRADDVLFVEVTPAADGWLTVATVQEDGRVSVLVSGEGLAAQRGEPVQVDGQIRLDGYAGREWLVVLRTDRPLASAQAVERTADLLPDPDRRRGPDTWVMEVSRP